MWCNTAFGDYPHLLPEQDNSTVYPQRKCGRIITENYFTGWMLLNYKNQSQFHPHLVLITPTMPTTKILKPQVPLLVIGRMDTNRPGKCFKSKCCTDQLCRPGWAKDHLGKDKRRRTIPPALKLWSSVDGKGNGRLTG